MGTKFELTLFLIFLECVCHILGTNKTAGVCDRESDSCPCFPNVNHWKIASGKVCEPCDCDPVGSVSLQCNEYIGQCECHGNFGGRQCNECRANFWGEPKENKCIRCECNPEGSETEQCDRKTGACKCRPGIGGYKCDRCDRGYIGIAPHCRPCGECFDNWDKTLNNFFNDTQLEITRAKNIKNVGAGGAYTSEFNHIKNVLDDIEDLLESTRSIDLDTVESKLDELRRRINETDHGPLRQLTELLANADNKNKVAAVTLRDFKKDMEKLRNKTEELRVNGTKLQERDVQGALEIIRNAKTKADNAANNATSTQDIIKLVERRCKGTENQLNSLQSTFADNTRKHEDDLASLKNLTEQIRYLNESLPELNRLVCGGTGYPCDMVCGGVLCGSCGAITCDGAKTKADTANELANKTKMLYEEKEKLVNEFIRNIIAVNGTQVKGLAQSAFDKSLEAKGNANNVSEKVEEKLKKIEEFMKQNKSITKEMQDKIEEVLRKNVKWQPQEIKEFAKKIKETADSLTNIEPILKETKGNLDVAKKLKEDAEEAKKNVDDIKTNVKSVEQFLNRTEKVQVETEANIDNIKKSFKEIKKELESIDRVTNGTYNQIEATSDNLGKLDKQLDELRKLKFNNEYTAQTLKNESINIKTKTEQTLDKLKQLEDNYAQAQKKLTDSVERADDSKDRAKILLDRTVTLTAKVKKTQDNIAKLQNSTSANLDNLEGELQRLIVKMDQYTAEIEKKAEYFKHCN